MEPSFSMRMEFLRRTLSPDNEGMETDLPQAGDDRLQPRRTLSPAKEGMETGKPSIQRLFAVPPDTQPRQ